MNTFFQRGFAEYKRQKKVKKAFEAHTERLGLIVRRIASEAGSPRRADRAPLAFHRHPSLVLLTPLIEIAWADGRVSRRELEVIAQVAETYKLVNSERGYRELIERLMSRPTPREAGQMWEELSDLLKGIKERERKAVCDALLVQTNFIAEQSSDGILAFLRGDRIQSEEHEALRIAATHLEKAKGAADQADIEKSVAAHIEKEKLYWAPASTSLSSGREDPAPKALADDSEKLIPLVPLVKVAWAEGRITRRERELIFKAAERMGIDECSPAHERLASWLELHPTDDFYFNSLEHLNSSWDELPPDEKTLRRLDLISDCINVAEASGGASRYPAGGRRVCEEEFAAVKTIAEKLRPNTAMTSRSV